MCPGPLRTPGLDHPRTEGAMSEDGPHASLVVRNLMCSPVVGAGARGAWVPWWILTPADAWPLGAWEAIPVIAAGWPLLVVCLELCGGGTWHSRSVGHRPLSRSGPTAGCATRSAWPRSDCPGGSVAIRLAMAAQQHTRAPWSSSHCLSRQLRRTGAAPPLRQRCREYRRSWSRAGSPPDRTAAKCRAWDKAGTSAGRLLTVGQRSWHDADAFISIRTRLERS